MKKNRKEKGNVPNLRFPEFKGEWKVKKLGEIAEIIGGGTPETSVPEYWNGEVQWFTPSEIKSNYTSKSERTITKLGLSKSSAKLLPVGTVLITTRATIGEVAIANEECSTNQGFQSLVVKEGANNIFVANWIKQNKNELIRRAKGSTFAEISRSEIERIPILLPAISEQTKIAQFLSLLDERIATQNKIIEQYKSLIKGIKNFIFSTIHGENVYLSQIAEIYQPKTISSNELLDDGKYLVYGANGIIGRYHSYNHESAQICITCRGSSCGTINYTMPKSWITGNSMVINTDNFASVINKRFLFHCLSSFDYNNIISGSGQPQIVKGPILKQYILLPNIAVQNRLAVFLDAFLCKIDIEQKILLNRQHQKQYLLAQMFI
jgi:type I restriction enzyme S subunit